MPIDARTCSRVNSHGSPGYESSCLLRLRSSVMDSSSSETSSGGASRGKHTARRAAGRQSSSVPRSLARGSSYLGWGKVGVWIRVRVRVIVVGA